MTEQQLMQAIDDLARMTGFQLRYHTHRSEHSPAGFPDWCFAKRGRLVFVEAKTTTGRVSAAQAAWIATLSTITRVDALVTRPATLQQLADLLAR